MNEKLTELIKLARLKKNMKQIEVAERLGVKKNTISNWETGKAKPDIDTFIKLCNIYEVDFSLILEESYKIERQLTALNFSLQEIDHIKKYRALDERSRQTIDTLLNNLYEIVVSKNESSPSSAPISQELRVAETQSNSSVSSETRKEMHRLLDEELDAAERGTMLGASDSTKSSKKNKKNR